MATKANSGGSDSGGAEEKGDEGRNMCPSEDAVALLNLKSKMDREFREKALKAPLWVEVSRKLSDKANRVEPTVDQIDSACYGFIVSTPTTSSERDSEESDTKGWKMADYFEKLMNKVLEKQEILQKQVLDTLERCEKDRIAREEAWRKQHIERVKKEHELRVNERAKVSVLIELLQKFSNQEIPVQLRDTLFPKPSLERQDDNPEHGIPESNHRIIDDQSIENSLDKPDSDPYIPENGVAERCNRSRWPKEEVETLIKIRTEHVQDGLKCPVWDEVSNVMKKYGYDREPKRCREKWDNINKYYRRVKESHKRKPGSSKTCPYFNLLDSIYQKKSAKVDYTLDWSSGTNQRPEIGIASMEASTPLN